MKSGDIANLRAILCVESSPENMRNTACDIKIEKQGAGTSK
jgi:hypothetical protein